MRQKINRKQIFDTVKEYIEIHGYAPAQREISDSLGCSLYKVNEYIRDTLDDGTLETDHPAGASRAYRIAGMRVVDTRELGSAVKQLGDLLNHCRDMAAGKDADPIWSRDVEALEAVIGAVRITEERRKQE